MTDYQNDMTSEALGARYRAAITGQEIGRAVLEEARKRIDAEYVDNPDLDPYLEYIVWTQVAYAIANEGRRIGKIDFGKRDVDLEGKKGGKR